MCVSVTWPVGCETDFASSIADFSIRPLSHLVWTNFSRGGGGG